MTTKEIVSQIHESDILGTFIEVGAGQPVAHALFNVEGASKTIYKAESPYNKDRQRELFDSYAPAFKLIEVKRSVSKEFVKKIISGEMAKGHAAIYHNTYFVSSFQIANEPGSLTHGWIGLRYRGNEKYYHLTLTNSGEERERIISIIGEIGLRILHSKNNLTNLVELFEKESAIYSCIDIIEDVDENPFLLETLSNLATGLEHPITISKEGKLIRLEDLSRAGNLMLMKGSFNPLHNHHLATITAAAKLYPDAIPCFTISLNTYEKGSAGLHLLVKRIQMLTKLGYPVVIFQKGFFNQNVSYLRNHRFINTPIIFPLGGDTVNRLIQSSYNGFTTIQKGTKINTDVAAFKAHFKDVEFPFMNRPGYPLIPETKMVDHFKLMGVDESSESSTNIRHLFATGEWEEIRNFVPVEIYDDVITYLKTIK